MSELGEITRAYTMTFERQTKHPVSKVWHAITDAEEVSRWIRYPARIDLRLGGEYHVDFSRTHSGDLDGVIVRIEPGRKLAYVWGLSLIEWTLEPLAEGTRYTMVHNGQALGLVDDEAGLVAGWHAFLDGFDGHLDGRTPTDEEDKAWWNNVLSEYRKRLEAVLPRS